MDWTDLSNRLADGAKVYKAFQDGANAASMLGGFERAQIELTAQYEALVVKVEQAKTELKAVQEETAHTRAAASQAIVAQQTTFDLAHTRQLEAAQAELDGWTAKVAEQMRASQKQAQWYDVQIAQWEAALAKLQGQVASLEQIKASLKSQLQGVV